MRRMNLLESGWIGMSWVGVKAKESSTTRRARGARTPKICVTVLRAEQSASTASRRSNIMASARAPGSAIGASLVSFLKMHLQSAGE